MMNSILWIAYLAVAGLAIVQALLLALQAWEHRRYARSCLRDVPQHRPRGRAMVLAPCKGADFALEENLRGLLGQDYDDFEITFIVEDATDPAAGVIRRVLAEHPAAAARLLVAGRATQSGQKVHNLRAATASVPPQVSYLVFLDSDAQPRPEWLRSMIARLAAGEAAVVTGYRWFTPDAASLAHKILYTINCTIMSLLGRNSQYMVWGGSWAVRRDTFDALGLHRAWQGTLSDDLVASRVFRRAKCRVSFQPAGVVGSPLSLSAAETLSFIRRQYLIARHYADLWWLLAIVSGTLRTPLVGYAAGNRLWTGLRQAGAVLPAAVGAALYALGACRGWIIQDLAGVYFPDRAAALRPFRRFAVWASPLAAMVEWLVLASTVLGRQIVWRGIHYRFLPRGRIVLAGRDEAPSRKYKKSRTRDSCETASVRPSGSGPRRHFRSTKSPISNP